MPSEQTLTFRKYVSYSLGNYGKTFLCFHISLWGFSSVFLKLKKKSQFNFERLKVLILRNRCVEKSACSVGRDQLEQSVDRAVLACSSNLYHKVAQLFKLVFV